jgi:beta-glucosidase
MAPTKLWVDGQLVLDFDGAPISVDVIDATSKSARTVDLKAGKFYNVKLEYRRLTGYYIPVQVGAGQTY